MIAAIVLTLGFPLLLHAQEDSATHEEHAVRDIAILAGEVLNSRGLASLFRKGWAPTSEDLAQAHHIYAASSPHPLAAISAANGTDAQFYVTIEVDQSYRGAENPFQTIQAAPAAVTFKRSRTRGQGQVSWFCSGGLELAVRKSSSHALWRRPTLILRVSMPNTAPSYYLLKP